MVVFWKPALENPGLPGKMHVGQIELLAPRRETQKTGLGTLQTLLWCGWNTSFRCSKSPLPVGNGIILTFRSTYEKGFSLYYCTDSKHHLAWNLRRLKKYMYHAQLLIVKNINPWKCFNQRFFNKLDPQPTKEKAMIFPMLPTNNLQKNPPFVARPPKKKHSDQSEPTIDQGENESINPT